MWKPALTFKMSLQALLVGFHCEWHVGTRPGFAETDRSYWADAVAYLEVFKLSVKLARLC